MSRLDPLITSPEAFGCGKMQIYLANKNELFREQVDN